MSVIRIFKFIFLFVILFFAVLVLVSNGMLVKVKIPPWGVMPEAPLSSVLVIAFFLGFMLCGVYSVVEAIRLSAKVSRLKKKNNLLEKEIANLRKEPMLDDSYAAEASEDDSHRDESAPDIDTMLDEETLNKIR